MTLPLPCHRCMRHDTCGRDDQHRPICGGCRTDEHDRWVEGPPRKDRNA